MATKKSRRPNGEGSIYADKTRNKLVAAVTGPDGRRITKRFPLTDRQAARDWLVEQQSDISRGDYVPRTDVTLGEWMLDFIRTYKSGLKPVTVSNYYYSAKLAAPIADVPLQDLTPVILQKYFNSLSCAHKTQIQVKVFLGMALRKAISLQMLKYNPLDQVEVTGGAPQNPIDVFTMPEITSVIAAAKSYNPRIYTMVMLAMYTGIRSGEMLALKWSDVDLKNGIIHIAHNIVEIHFTQIYQSTPKTDASRRDITIPSTLVDVLSDYKHQKISPIDIEDQYVFHRRNGHAVGSNMVRYFWGKIQKIAGVPHRKFHALRHTHASQLLAAGVPITEVSRRLGHSNPAITLKVYSHFIPGNDRAVADKVQEIFGS
jgi:integrase